MIAYAILKEFADNTNGFELDKNCFYEELPLSSGGKPAQGVWVVTRGGSIRNTPKGLNQRAILDFYVAFANKIQTDSAHQAILKWLRSNQTICELSGTISKGSYAFSNIRLFPTSTPQNNGATENGVIVKFASTEIVYDISN